jgi:hypothetical protein
MGSVHREEDRKAVMNSLKTLADLKQDQSNRRAHTARNLAMITDSLRAVGAGRSIVIDENDTILAGNATVRAASDLGLTKVQTIDVDADTIVAVRRSGLSDKEKRDLALYDNRSAELAEWDVDQLKNDQEEGADLATFFSNDELQDLFAAEIDTTVWADELGKLGSSNGSNGAGFSQVSFILTEDQAKLVQACVDHAKGAGLSGNKNGAALAVICNEYNKLHDVC